MVETCVVLNNQCYFVFHDHSAHFREQTKGISRGTALKNTRLHVSHRTNEILSTGCRTRVDRRRTGGSETVKDIFII